MPAQVSPEMTENRENENIGPRRIATGKLRTLRTHLPDHPHRIPAQPHNAVASQMADRAEPDIREERGQIPPQGKTPVKSRKTGFLAGAVGIPGADSRKNRRIAKLDAGGQLPESFLRKSPERQHNRCFFLLPVVLIKTEGSSYRRGQKLSGREILRKNGHPSFAAAGMPLLQNKSHVLRNDHLYFAGAVRTFKAHKKVPEIKEPRLLLPVNSGKSVRINLNRPYQTKMPSVSSFAFASSTAASLRVLYIATLIFCDRWKFACQSGVALIRMA